MPTLTRILVLFAILAIIIYGAMLALAVLVKPATHQITIEIPASKINQTIIPPPVAPQFPANSEPTDTSTESTLQDNQ